jgi:hypothetical protein
VDRIEKHEGGNAEAGQFIHPLAEKAYNAGKTTARDILMRMSMMAIAEVSQLNPDDPEHTKRVSGVVASQEVMAITIASILISRVVAAQRLTHENCGGGDKSDSFLTCFLGVLADELKGGTKKEYAFSFAKKD